ncbi:MAG: DUF1700 domain-containing protein [Lactobacillaceae bacterium]|jgi:uncharacterized membrane protein|nr:DUF1700 domain-containing protein [Lactobacillaceae bacterium]
MIDDYFTQTEKYLNNVPVDDRKELIQFYKEQALDAQLDSTQLEEKYGTPKNFARKLKIEYFIDNDNQTESSTKNKISGLQLVAMVILGLFATPVLIPLAVVVVLSFAALIGGLLAFIFAVYAGIVATLGVGLVSIFVGFGLFGQSIASAIFYIGLGIFLTGLVIFGGSIVVNLTKWLFMQIIRFAKFIGRRFLKVKKGEQA